MTLATSERTCRCGAPLGSWRGANETLCRLCESRLTEPDAETLYLVVASILLRHWAEHRDRQAVDLRAELEGAGYRTDADAVNEAVRKCRRRRISFRVSGLDWHIESERMVRGYLVQELQSWQRPRRRRRRRSPQLRLEV